MKNAQEMSVKGPDGVEASGKGKADTGGKAQPQHEHDRSRHRSADKTAAGGEGVSVRPDVQARLGDKLKEVYSDVLNAPVPDRFTELLSQLESSPGPKSGSGE